MLAAVSESLPDALGADLLRYTGGVLRDDATVLHMRFAGAPAGCAPSPLSPPAPSPAAPSPPAPSPPTPRPERIAAPK